MLYHLTYAMPRKANITEFKAKLTDHPSWSELKVLPGFDRVFFYLRLTVSQ